MTRVRRRLAALSCTLIERALPPKYRHWAEAIRIEVSEIESDTQALSFALNSLLSLSGRAAAFRLLRLSSTITGSENLLSQEHSNMTYLDEWQATPRSVGALCAIGATCLGLFFMVMGGAPLAYLGINVGALVVGFLLCANVTRSRLSWTRWHGPLMMIAGLCLSATALVGLQVDGATRWVKLGPIALQPSLVLVPMMIVAFSRMLSWMAAFGLIAAALALALQPDRAMSAALAAGAITLLVSQRDRMTISVAIASVVGFVITMLRPDAGQAVPFVDQIIFNSFDVHVAAGIAVVGGLALLILPAIVGYRYGGDTRAVSLVFGVTWSTVIVAAALGNYPTPLVGYSGAAILGYVLSLATLPKVGVSKERNPIADESDVNTLPEDASFMLGKLVDETP